MEWLNYNHLLGECGVSFFGTQEFAGLALHKTFGQAGDGVFAISESPISETTGPVGYSLRSGGVTEPQLRTFVSFAGDHCGVDVKCLGNPYVVTLFRCIVVE